MEFERSLLLCYAFPMRFTIDNEQKKFFRQQGWLKLEGLLLEEERNALFLKVEKILINDPGDSFERGRFLSRSVPLILQLVRRREWAELAKQLVDKAPLRLAYDHVFHDPSEKQKQSLQSVMQQSDTQCGLLLSFEKGHAPSGIFFKDTGFEQLYFTPHQWYLLLVFTPHFLNDDHHPIVTRR